MAVELAVIILNFRTAALTIECLSSLAAEVGLGIGAVVVDNASGDGSAERIEGVLAARGWSSWARVIRSAVNGGFAAGNNLGMRSVEAAAYLLLNSDTLVRRGALDSLRLALRLRPDAGIVGPRILNARGEPDFSAFRFPSPGSELVRAANSGPVTRVLGRWDVVLPHRDAPSEPGWVGFAGAVVRSEVLRSVGALDDGYFMYFEDVDYCRRAREAGWKVLHWPAAEIVHLGGCSSQVTSAAGRLKRAPRYFYEARARYFAKFYGRAGLWLANVLWCVGRTLSWTRERLGRPGGSAREREVTDIWTNATQPLGSPRRASA